MAAAVVSLYYAHYTYGSFAEMNAKARVRIGDYGMKRLCAALLLCLTLLGCIGIPAASETKTMRVGLPTIASAFMVTGDDAHTALLTETLHELAKYTDWTYEFVSGTSEQLHKMMTDGEIDLLAGVYYRDDLADEGVLYPRYLTGYSYALLVTDPEDDTIQRDDFRSMQGMRIAADYHMTETQRLLGYLSLNNVQGTILYTDSSEESAQMLLDEKADMALLSSERAEAFRTVAKLVVEPYYIAVSPGREDLALAIDDAYAMILDADPDYLDTLYDKHFGWLEKRDPQLTRAEKAFITESPALRVAVPDGLAPLNYYVSDDAKGISVDVLALIGEYTGLDITMVHADSIPQAIEMVQTGDVDGVLGIPFSDETAMEADIIMTNSYVDAPRVAICNNQVVYPSQGMTIAVIPGMDFMIDSFTGDIIYADTFWECVNLVNTGAADYTYGVTYFLEYSTQSRMLRNIYTYTLPSEQDHIGIGLRRPANPLLLTAINKAINSIADDAMLNVVMQNTTLHEEDKTLEYFVYSYPMLMVLFLGIFTVVIVAAVVIITFLRARHSRALYKTQFTDELTGALNLAGFRREANRLLQNPDHYALSYTTIRSFHFINERYGYEEGDEVLRRVTAIYREDIDEGEVFCRVSGGTFVALRLYKNQADYLQRMDRLFAAFHEITPRTDPGYHIRVVSGIFLSEEEKHGDVFSMMDRANAAQQKIRSSAEITRAIYEEGSYDDLMYLQELESRMESALENDDFLVVLQPKYNLSTMKPGGAEALVRWNDGGRIIPPSDFIPQFERNGFISHLDRYVFAKCCMTLRRWIDTGMPIVPISVNVSRVQLYSPTFLKDYVAIRDQYNIPHGMLELEFTESILFEDVDKLIEIVRDMHENGFECSIDDFGKGYSSLTILKNIPADVIKLDAQFFDTGIDQQRDTIIVESIVDIAKALGMTSIAEGIEHKHQVKLLQMLGCDMIQGYVFSRPLSIADFEQYLHEKIVDGKDPYAPLGG